MRLAAALSESYRYGSPETYVLDGADMGKTLRFRRRSMGIRQAQVARDLGYSVRLVSEIENGRDTVGYGKILQYAAYLGIDMVMREREIDVEATC